MKLTTPVQKTTNPINNTVDSCMKSMAFITMGFATFACARYIDATPIKPSYIKVDDADDVFTAIARKNIRWIKKHEDSYLICTNVQGCYNDNNNTSDKWKISKAKNPESYRDIETFGL
jgi:hypothetical protein